MMKGGEIYMFGNCMCLGRESSADMTPARARVEVCRPLRELFSVILAFFNSLVSTLPSIPISNSYPSTIR